MRRVVLGSVLAVISLGLAGAPATAVTRHQCRTQWDDLVQLHGENGNPRGPVRELTRRWKSTDRGARSYAESASARDCGQVIEDYATGWDELESFMYDISPYDLAQRLAYAEANRQHALELHHVRHLSPRLERRFRIARRQEPAAAADLAPALSGAPSVDVSDPAAVQGELDQLHDAAVASRHVRRFERALRVIDNAELDEE